MPHAMTRNPRTLRRLGTVLVVLLLNAACSTEAEDLDRASLEAEVLAWRETRLASLMSPTGFLNLAGLFWLESETATFGSSPDNDLVFPGSADARIGRFRVTADGVVMEPGEGTVAGVDHHQARWALRCAPARL